MKSSNGMMEVFKIFQNTESYFNERNKAAIEQADHLSDH